MEIGCRKELAVRDWGAEEDGARLGEGDSCELG